MKVLNYLMKNGLQGLFDIVKGFFDQVLNGKKQ